MKLTTSFNIETHEVVSFVGGGGKTTSISRLARELSDGGSRAIITSTTRLGVGETLDHELCSVGTTTQHLRPEMLNQIKTQLAHRRVAIVVGEKRPSKLLGIQPRLISDLRPLAEAVLVEADGARSRSLKAPAPYEPVWPVATTTAVAVVGIDAVGAPLNSIHVHRPERVAALTGLSLGELVTPSAVATCILHPAGLFARVPVRARRILLLNKVKTDAQLVLARNIAKTVTSHNSLAQVIIADVRVDVVTAWQ